MRHSASPFFPLTVVSESTKGENNRNKPNTTNNTTTHTSLTPLSFSHGSMSRCCMLSDLREERIGEGSAPLCLPLPILPHSPSASHSTYTLSQSNSHINTSIRDHTNSLHRLSDGEHSAVRVGITFGALGIDLTSQSLIAPMSAGRPKAKYVLSTHTLRTHLHPVYASLHRAAASRGTCISTAYQPGDIPTSLTSARPGHHRPAPNSEEV